MWTLIIQPIRARRHFWLPVNHIVLLPVSSHSSIQVSEARCVFWTKSFHSIFHAVLHFLTADIFQNHCPWYGSNNEGSSIWWMFVYSKPLFTVTCCPTHMCVTVTWHGWASGWRKPGWWAETPDARSLPSWRKSPYRTWLRLTSPVMVHSYPVSQHARYALFMSLLMGPFISFRFNVYTYINMLFHSRAIGLRRLHTGSQGSQPKPHGSS